MTWMWTQKTVWGKIVFRLRREVTSNCHPATVIGECHVMIYWPVPHGTKLSAL